MKPKELILKFKSEKRIVGLGAHTKNTICYLKGQSAFISPIHNDLGILSDYRDFLADFRSFKKNGFDIIACDLHPDYQSTKLAEQEDYKKFRKVYVQHHHAHIASCMAENGLPNEPVIGIAFDGTGMGTDSRLWGAEFMVCDYRGFERIGHLKEVPLIGGERAVIEPWRIAAFWLSQIYRSDFLKLKIPFIKEFPFDKWKIIQKMYLSGVNSPVSSSMGRLFDAVASLVLAKYQATFEAEPAIALEKLACQAKVKSEGYHFDISMQDGVFIVSPYPVFRGLVSDIKKGTDHPEISYKFHKAVCRMVHSCASLIRKKRKLKNIVLSGGVFQNNILLSTTLDLLYKSGFTVFTHKKLSCSDSCISLGQAAVASFQRI
jgi:hydrogenase maturation protein HypF